MSSLPASILDRSSTSEITAASVSALSPICSRYWRRRASSTSGRRASRARPTSPFSGVRISWLVLARKALFARLAASASSRALASACSKRRRSVMFSTIQMVPPRIGCVGSTALASMRHQKLVPSRRTSSRTNSTGSPRASGGPISAPISAYWASLAQTARPGWPVSVPRSQPSICSRAGLACTNLPSRVKAMPIEAFSSTAS